MYWRRRGRTRGGCIIVPIPCGCLLSPLVLIPGAIVARRWAGR